MSQWQVVPMDVEKCPSCGNVTDSLKRYSFLQIVFLGLYASEARIIVTACPRCMREYIICWSLISVFTTNVFWPFVVFPLLIARLPSTFRRGANLQKRPWTKQIAGDVAYLGMLVAVFAVLAAILWLTFGNYPPQTMLLTVIASGIAVLAICGLVGSLADI